MPASERYIGLYNYGNTCYANCVLQCLYFCTPFRAAITAFSPRSSSPPRETAASVLADIFSQISSHRRRTGVLGPEAVLRRVRAESPAFRGAAHQDAHEFLMWLLNAVDEAVTRDAADACRDAGCLCPVCNACCAGGAARCRCCPPDAPPLASTSATRPPPPSGRRCGRAASCVQAIFGGRVAAVTRCLSCETPSARHEPVLVTSVSVSRLASLSASLRAMCSPEALRGRDAFRCDVCCANTEAARTLEWRDVPPVVCVQLKRFEFDQAAGVLRKRRDRVPFAATLRLPSAPGVVYVLSAVVAHVGATMNVGHYVAFVRSGGRWVFCDDDRLSLVPEAHLHLTFGTTPSGEPTAAAAYLLFYSAADCGVALPPPAPPPPPPPPEGCRAGARGGGGSREGGEGAGPAAGGDEMAA